MPARRAKNVGSMRYATWATLKRIAKKVTEAGRIFYVPTRRLVDEANEVEQLIRRLAELAARILIGFVPFASYGVLPAAIRALRETAPKVEISLIEMFAHYHEVPQEARVYSQGNPFVAPPRISSCRGSDFRGVDSLPMLAPRMPRRFIDPLYQRSDASLRAEPSLQYTPSARIVVRSRMRCLSTVIGVARWATRKLSAMTTSPSSQ